MFEIRKNRTVAQGPRTLVRERVEYLRLTDRGERNQHCNHGPVGIPLPPGFPHRGAGRPTALHCSSMTAAVRVPVSYGVQPGVLWRMKSSQAPCTPMSAVRPSIRSRARQFSSISTSSTWTLPRVAFEYGHT